MSTVTVKAGKLYDVVIPSLGDAVRTVYVSTLNVERNSVSLREHFLRDHYLGVFSFYQVQWIREVKPSAHSQSNRYTL